MKMLMSQEDFEKTKGNVQIPFQCCYCQKTFYIARNYVLAILKNKDLINKKKRTGEYCTPRCNGLDNTTKVKVNCVVCNIKFSKVPSQIKRTKNNFCSKSCAATYNNTHKTKGTRISKLEVYLSKELPILYPNLKFHFNRKDTINSELDIYIPSLKLAFELNGIFHYEPIYGQEKLAQILNNDQRKFQACLEKGIELCIIDSSKLIHFKPEKAKVYLDIITGIIDSKLARTN